ncbi:hypothetical protein ZWY2020_052807 [Hordeum vulgare]|nr:hypothetical protein ZWY2020_052807 [Hordeum vulgare]
MLVSRRGTVPPYEVRGSSAKLPDPGLGAPRRRPCLRALEPLARRRAAAARIADPARAALQENTPSPAAVINPEAPGQANVPKIASLIISESKVPEAPDFPGPSSLSSPEQPILKKQKKGVQIPSTALLASSDVSDSSSPSSKQVDGKKPKKVNTCARCRRQKQGCKDCVFADVFTTETQSDYDKASELFGIKSMQNRLSLVQPQDRLQVREAIMWRVAAWANDPLHGPLGRFRNLEREAAAAAASAAAARLAARSLLTSSY